MRTFLTALLCIFCLNAGAAAPEHSPVVAAWRAVVFKRLAKLMPGQSPDYPDNKKLIRALNMTEPSHGSMVTRGDVPFTLKHATAITDRFGVDREWVLASDHLHAQFASYQELQSALANERSPVVAALAETYLAFNEEAAAAWTADYPIATTSKPPTNEPFLTVTDCDRQLSEFSGADLLQLQLLITQELIRRNGNMR